MEILLTPPFAFLIYIPLVVAIFMVGKGLAGSEANASPLKRSLYGSGELAPTNMSAPGYRPYFLIAFFFAILHLGVLVVATGTLSVMMIPYLVGLILALIALLLG